MIQICTFGGLSVFKEAEPVCQNLGPITRELFSYLAVHSDATQRRERIAEMFWPEKTQSRSRSSLNTALWRINGSLKSAHIDNQVAIVRASESCVVMSMGTEVTLDCVELSKQVETCAGVAAKGPLIREMRAALRAALTRYSEGFMEGVESDWVMRDRERYRCLFERGMTIMMRDYALCGRLDEALACGATILEGDALRETTLRAVMWLHVMNGQRGRAIEQYLTLRRKLREELNMDPMPDTTLLYRHILGKDDAIDALMPGAAEAASGASIKERLRGMQAHRASVLDSIFEADIEAI
jgi:DNA-binding SARP family transcriptional activator